MRGVHVVITGGPGSGKTTLVEELGARGYATVPEAAIQVIARLNEEMGVEAQQRFRRSDSAGFQELVLELQLELEKEFEEREGVVFLDRGRLDGLAYLRHFEEAPSVGQLELLTARTYDRVFLLETLSVFEDRSDSGRMSKRADSLAIARTIDQVYREYGHEPIAVPECSVDDRVALVLEHLDP